MNASYFPIPSPNQESATKTRFLSRISMLIALVGKKTVFLRGHLFSVDIIASPIILDHTMPNVSKFYGIQIHQQFREHGVPHFHAVYAGIRASIAIETLEFLAGDLPRRARNLVIEWAALHRAELLANWEKSRQGILPDDIEPLP
jgi:hypothetical protein